jgi:hypothetical protein
MKVTKRQFDGLVAARKDYCVNDAYVRQRYGVTVEQVSCFMQACAALVGLEWQALTLADLNAALDGKKVALCRLDHEIMDRFERAFAVKVKAERV